MAILLPVFVALILFSLSFLELVRTRLRLLEVGRSAAWNLSAHPIADFQTARHQEAFSRAAAAVRRETVNRHLARGWGNGGFAVQRENLSVELKNRETLDAQLRPSFSPSNAQGLGSALFSGLGGGIRPLLKRFHLDTADLVTATASVDVRNRLFPGSTEWLQRLPIKSRFALRIADWHLGEGEDAVMRFRRDEQGNRAGPSAFYTQLQRMTLFGLKDRLTQLPGMSAVLQLVGGTGLDPTMTYLASRNYRPPANSAEDRECDYLREYPESARHGMSNLRRDGPLDSDRPSCFDTSPFRDQARYQDSLYIKLFESRGPWFMGCKRAQADDPSDDGSDADRAESFAGCG
jgi:hypothetical protein